MNRVISMAIVSAALLVACGGAATAPSLPTPTRPALVTPTSIPATATRPAATAAPPTPTTAPATATRPAATATPALATSTVAPASPAPSGDASAGKALFAAKGCSACHGAEAQGGVGPNLKAPKRTADAITSVVRSGQKIMPAFPPAQVSDVELKNIIAFLQAP